MHRGGRLLAPLAGALLAFALMLPFLKLRFYSDDYILLYESLHATSLTGWLSSAYYGTFRPLLWIDCHMCAVLFGTNEVAYHAVSFCIFALTVALFIHWLLGQRGDVLAAVVGGLIFLSSPAQWTTVPWLAANADVLAGLFLVATLIAFDGWLQEPKAWRMMAVAVLGTLGLCSKETSAVLPLLLAVRAAQRKQLRHGLAMAAFLAVLAVAVYLPELRLVISRRMEQALPPLSNFQMNDLSKLFLGQISALIFTPLRMQLAPTDFTVLFCTALGALALLWLLGRGNPMATFGLAWTLIWLLPTLTVASPGLYLRYLYLPCGGLGAMAYAALSGKRSAVAAAVVVGLLYLRLEYWAVMAVAAAVSPAAPGLRPLPAALEAKVRSAPRIYVYQRPDFSTYLPSMLALLLDCPRDRVVDLSQVARGAPWVAQSCALLHDERNDRWVDITRPISVMRQNAAFSALPPLQSWRPWKVEAAERGTAAITLHSRGAASALLSPRLEINPLRTQAVEVRLIFPDFPRASMQVGLDWASDDLPFFEPRRGQEVLLPFTTNVVAGWESVWFFPGENTWWWKSGTINWLRVHPLSRPGRSRLVASSCMGINDSYASAKHSSLMLTKFRWCLALAVWLAGCSAPPLRASSGPDDVVAKFSSVPTLGHLQWRPAAVNMAVPEDSVLLTDVDASMQLRIEADCFTPAFLDAVAQGRVGGFQRRAETVFLDIPPGALFPYRHDAAMHRAGCSASGVIVAVSGAAFVSTDHDKIRRDFAALTPQVLRSTVATGPPAGASKGIGIRGKEAAALDAAKRQELALSDPTPGVYVESVFPGSAASRAGILPDDIVVRFGNVPIRRSTDLFAALDAADKSRPIPIQVFRPQIHDSLQLYISLPNSRGPSPAPSPQP